MKKKVKKAGAVLPRRITVAGVEGEVRNVSDAFAAAHAAKQGVLEVVKQQIKAFSALQKNLEGIN